jgi:hypothetical protein
VGQFREVEKVKQVEVYGEVGQLGERNRRLRESYCA